MRVCQTCGSIAYPETLIVCSKCRTISEHTYCLDKSEETDDGEVIWACEFCEPRDIEPSSPTNITSDTEMTESFKEPQNGAEEPLSPIISEEAPRVIDGDDGPPIKELQSFYRDLEKSHNLPEQVHNIDGSLHLPDECSGATGVETSNSGSPGTSSKIEDDFSSNIEPLPNSIWQGSFKIYGEYASTVHGMVAHVSNVACKEASDVASSLPVLLWLEMVPKMNIWPMKFKKMGPTGDDVAVYFFPEDDRVERVYDCLVDEIIEHEFAMISKVDNVELLIFSSCELPQDNWRFQRKYYLWGLFRRKKKTLPQVQNDYRLSSPHGSINHPCPSNLSTETIVKETELKTQKFGSSPPKAGE